MTDAPTYIKKFVNPKINDFEREPASVRRALLACMAVFHTIDYMAGQPGSLGKQNLRGRFRKESADFEIVDRVAHAFKHRNAGDGNSPDNKPLNVQAIFSRPRSFAGEMVPGLTYLGDTVGGVEIWNERGQDLLGVVKRASKFLLSKV